MNIYIYIYTYITLSTTREKNNQIKDLNTKSSQREKGKKKMRTIARRWHYRSARQSVVNSRGPLFEHHNNTFKTITDQGRYGCAHVANDELLSDDIPHVELAYDKIEYGNGLLNPSVIILHGLYGHRGINRHLGLALSKQLQTDVYLLDLRNHGDSPHIGRFDYISMARDVERFVQKRASLLHKPPILVGHSMGGKVAMSCVLRRPHLFGQMCSIDMAPVAARLLPTTEFPTYNRVLREIVRPDSPVRTHAQAEEWLQLAGAEPVMSRFLVKSVLRSADKKKAGAGLRSRVPLGILQDAVLKGNVANWEFNPWVHRWDGPTLLIRATRSPYVRHDEALRQFGRFFPHRTVCDIDAGHWVNTEQPTKCIDAITRFVAKNKNQVK